MPRLPKFLLVFVLLVFVLACNFVTQPIRYAQEAVETVQSFATAMPLETLQSFATAMPLETFEAFPSAFPDFENMFDPQGQPLSEWNEIPIMPEATAGQEFTDTNTYSFRADVTAKDIEDFYTARMIDLGWTQPFPGQAQGDGTIMVFQKDSSSLTILIVASEGSLVVVLTLV